MFDDTIYTLTHLFKYCTVSSASVALPFRGYDSKNNGNRARSESLLIISVQQHLCENLGRGETFLNAAESWLLCNLRKVFSSFVSLQWVQKG